MRRAYLRAREHTLTGSINLLGAYEEVAHESVITKIDDVVAVDETVELRDIYEQCPDVNEDSIRNALHRSDRYERVSRGKYRRRRLALAVPNPCPNP